MKVKATKKKKPVMRATKKQPYKRVKRKYA